MFLVDNFKIILLVGLVCTAGIRPSRAATKCMRSGYDGEESAECMGDKDTCMLSDGSGGLETQACVTVDNCPLDEGKEIDCKKVGMSMSLRCCCKEDDCNSKKPGGKYYIEFCKQRAPGLGIEGCPEPMKCYDGNLPKDARIKECENYPDDVCFVAALPAGRLLPRDSLKVTIDTGALTNPIDLDNLDDLDLTADGGKIGETGCKPKAECPIEDGKEWKCDKNLCCCNAKECNSPKNNRFKIDFCNAGNFAEKCPRAGGPAPAPDPSPAETKADWNAATGPFQHYYGGFPFAVLVAASIYYFPLEAFF